MDRLQKLTNMRDEASDKADMYKNKALNSKEEDQISIQRAEEYRSLAQKFADAIKSIFGAK